MDAVHERGRRRRRGTVSRLLKFRTAEKVESLPATSIPVERGHRGNLRYRDNSFVWNANPIEIFPFFPKRNFLSTRRRKRDVFMVRFDWIGSKGTWYDDVVSQFITAFMPLFEKKGLSGLSVIVLTDVKPPFSTVSTFEPSYRRKERTSV